MPARPTGSIYSSRPANAAEAKERRLARFEVSADVPCSDGCATGRDKPGLPDDSGSAPSRARRGDFHEQARTDAMTVDLYQTPLRYGGSL